MGRKRGRITVQHQPTGAEQGIMRGMGLFHAVLGIVVVVISLTEIIPLGGLFGLPFMLGGILFAANGIRVMVSKNGISHRVGYDVETELDQSIAGLMEDVPDTTCDPVMPNYSTVEKRLETLQDLYARKIITAEEYETKRKEILQEL